jgi:Na+-transporting methylmalonyl-CoA/oxaloacetate decarboxylase gamma subunit
MNWIMNSTLVYNQAFGFTVALVGFSIVIISLTLLVIIFSRLPKILNFKFRKKSLKKESTGGASDITDLYNIEGNVTAAISLALHLYFNELHDEESNVITIKKVRKSYSPWSSKIYGVTQNWPTK